MLSIRVRMSPDDPYKSLAQPFLAHYDLLRGSSATTARQFDRHLPPPPGKIIDAGGGAGHQAFRLADRGYQVVLADPSEEMLRRATERPRRKAAAARPALLATCTSMSITARMT